MPLLLGEVTTAAGYDWSGIQNTFSSSLSTTVQNGITMIVGVLPTILLVIGVGWAVKKVINFFKSTAK